MDTIETFKTPNYQRKAYKSYLERKKQDPEKYEEFKQKLKENQKKYYQKNREKILAKKKKVKSEEIN